MSNKRKNKNKEEYLNDSSKNDEDENIEYLDDEYEEEPKGQN